MVCGKTDASASVKLLSPSTQAINISFIPRFESDQADGTFRLDQTVTFQSQPSQERSWILKTIRQNHYTGTLSDAAGRVTGLTNGSRLLLEYRVKGPLIMHQTLELMPDGKTIDNVGKITFLGIPVGHLHETITRKD